MMTDSIVADAMRDASHDKVTENGAYTRDTTGDALVDLFGTIGALRGADENRITRLFADAYAEDPLVATKILFYSRDVRGGLGERETFRTIVRWLATHHPEAVRDNIRLFGHFGRYDDLYALMDTPLEGEMWRFMGLQLGDDIANARSGKGEVSLLAKWVKTPGVSSKASSALGHRTAKALGCTDRDFKRAVRALRKRIGIVESKMSANDWGNIDYSGVPSRAMTNYRAAFKRHDADRFCRFVSDALQVDEDGNAKAAIHSQTLCPYDIVSRVRRGGEDTDVLEAQWRQLPDYVDDDANVLVMADVSGSMSYSMDGHSTPLDSSIGLAIYFAERNHGPFGNVWMDFSARSGIHELQGETLAQKIASLSRGHWGMNTNLEAAFDNLLKHAVDNHATQADMPKSIVIVSDMEIDAADGERYERDGNGESGKVLFHDRMARKYADHGYELPSIVYWNVESRNDTFHASADRPGVMLCSGRSAGTFRNVVSAIGMTPYEAMMNTIGDARYEVVTVAGQ